jgi:hypothetical protein
MRADDKMINKDYLDLEYLLLAYAILVSDEPNDKKNEYGLIVCYDMKDNERFCGIFNTLRSCCNMNGITIRYLMSCIKEEKIYKGRYKFERLILDDN